MKKQLIFLVLIFLVGCSKNELADLDFMLGSWKMEGKEQYEVWEKPNNNEFAGYSYRIKNGDKKITETLSIKLIAGEIIYEATVPDQNEGKTVRFKLNADIRSYFSFENPEHDFPKKIQYKRINDNKIEVTVVGNEDQGFSYIQIRQLEE